MRPIHTSMQTLAGLYGIFLVVLGVVLPLSVFLSGSEGSSGTYLTFAVFQILIYLIGACFLLTLNIFMRIHKNKHYRCKNKEEDTEPATTTPPEPGTPPHNAVSNNLSVTKRVVVATILPHANEDDHAHHFNTVCHTKADECLFCYSGEGVNFFLRLGAIGFGMASIALDGFQISQFMHEEAWECLGATYLAAAAAHLIFIFMQTHFIFKHHRIVINFHKAWVRLGLLHLVATNLCNWASVVILESVEAFIHIEEHQTHKDSNHEKYNYPSNHGHNGSHSNYTDVYSNNASSSGTHDVKSGGVIALVNCLEASDSISANASPYLYPCAIEFALISAAMIYRIFCHVGATVDKEKRHRERLANSVITAMSGDCQKAHSGLFLGLLLDICSVIGLFFFISYDSSGDAEKGMQALLIYFSIDNATHVISIIALAIAFYKITKLHYIGRLENEFDQNLVIVAVAGHFLLFVFLLVPSIQKVGKTNNDFSIEIYADMMTALSILTIIQSAIQVTFIVDGLRRRSSKVDHFRHKPGRSVITFLILCNLAMWSANSFQLKNVHNSPIHVEFYGVLAWNIIVHLCLPLAIFFRFHSCICLSDIWMTAYRVDSDHVGQKPEEDKEEEETYIVENGSTQI